MILTCPECATSYFVDDSRVPAAGRTVKCSNCGAKWTAVPEGAPSEPAPKPAPAPAPRPEPPRADDLVVDGPEDAPLVAPITPRRRPATPSKPPPRKAGSPVMVLVATAAVIVGLLAGVIAFRSEIARIFPASRVAFAKVGLPAEPLGLVIEQVRADPAFQGGRPVLVITGQIRNVRDTAAMAPALRVSLLDKAEKPLAAKVAHPIDGRVPKGAVRHFAIAIVDPPFDTHDLEVTFDKAATPAVRTHASAFPTSLAPPPVDAKPLPPGSPDALPPHD
jgi:predicted Zn finger-like uncharacterized protein